MDWVETTGRTVEEATKAALEQLGVDEADADVEVIAEPKLGLFGWLREEARVRARVQPRYPRAKQDRRDRRRPRAQEGQAAGAGTPASDTASAPAGEEAQEQAGETAAVARGGRSAPRSRARSVESTSAPAEARPRRSPRQTTTKPEEGGGEANFSEVTVQGQEDQAELAETFLKGLIAEMGTTATVSSHPVADGIIEVDIEGDGLSTLIGPKGTTLAALQELTRTVLQRQGPAEGRVVLDVNGYRKRRQEALSRFAQQVAQEVRASGAKRALEPMPAPDRKVVHDVVNDIEGVRTLSEGEEPYRRVVLVPDQGGSGAAADTEAAPAVG